MKNEERSMAIKNMLMGNKAAIIVLLLILCLSFASPVFLTWSNLLNVVRQICVSTLLSIGFTVALASGEMDLSIGTMMGLCGMVMAKLVKEANVPLPVAILVIFLLAILGGILNASIISLFSRAAFYRYSGDPVHLQGHELPSLRLGAYLRPSRKHPLLRPGHIFWESLCLSTSCSLL